MECTALKDFRTKIKLQLEPETQIQCNVCYVSDSRLYGKSLCLLINAISVSLSLHIVDFGEFGELFRY